MPMPHIVGSGLKLYKERCRASQLVKITTHRDTANEVETWLVAKYCKHISVAQYQQPVRQVLI